MSDKTSQPQPALNFDAAKVEDSIRRVERNKQAAKSYRSHQGLDTCGCCGQAMKEWRHTLSSLLGEMLVQTYRHVQSHGNKPFKASDLHTSYSGGSNYCKISYWDLIEHGSPEEKKAGLWRLTEKGEQFVRGTIRLPKRVWTWDAKPVEYEGKMVLITDLVPNFNWRVAWAQEDSRAHAA